MGIITRTTSTNASIKDDLSRKLLNISKNSKSDIDFKEIRTLIEKGADFNITDEKGNTPLHFLARTNSAAADLLIKKGANVGATNKNGRTPLHFAAAVRANLDAVTLLLEAGAEVSATDKDGRTPLHFASAYRSNSDVVKLLIDADADVAAADKDKKTPLHFAAAVKGNSNIVGLLMQAGAPLGATDNHGQNPFHIAARAGQVDILETLLMGKVHLNSTTENILHDLIEVFRLLFTDNNLFTDKEPQSKPSTATRDDLNAADYHGRTPLHAAVERSNLKEVKLFLEKKVYLNPHDKYGRTPLHSAAWKSDSDIAKVLIEAGADMEALDLAGNTPLLIAAQEEITSQEEDRAAQERNLNIIKMFVEEGANIKATNLDGRGVLHLAAKEGKLELVKYLISVGADFKSSDEYAKNPLHSAALGRSSNHFEIVKLLKQKGADFNSPDKDGDTALHLAAWSGNRDTVKFLRDSGANLNAANNRGYTPLQFAVQTEQWDTVKFLIEEGADLNIQDLKGTLHLFFSEENSEGLKSPIPYGLPLLLLAILADQPAIVKLVIERQKQRGVNFNIPADNDGHTPLHFAAQSHNLDTVQYLVENGADVNADDNEGNTPLIWAVKASSFHNPVVAENNLRIVEFLVEKGANISAVNNNRENVLAIAKRQGEANIIKFLEDTQKNKLSESSANRFDQNIQHNGEASTQQAKQYVGRVTRAVAIESDHGDAQKDDKPIYLSGRQNQQYGNYIANGGLLANSAEESPRTNVPPSTNIEMAQFNALLFLIDFVVKSIFTRVKVSSQRGKLGFFKNPNSIRGEQVEKAMGIFEDALAEGNKEEHQWGLEP